MITRCWNCGKEHDSKSPAFHEAAEEIKPSNGDRSFCIDCGNFAIFDDSFPDKVRKPTPSENFEIRTDKNCERLVLVWTYMRRLGEKEQ